MDNTAELKKNILISLILIFFLKSNAESDKAWLEFYSEKYDNNPVVDIIKDYDKDLYLATSSTFYKIREDFTLEEIKIDSKFINKKILKIYPSRKKSIYVLFEAENNECIITEYINSKWIELGQIEMNHKVFFEDSKNRLWSMDYKSNILLFSDNKWNTTKYNSGFFDTQNEHLHKEAIDRKQFNPINFLEDSKDRIWIYSRVIAANYISMTEILCYYNEKFYVFPLTSFLEKSICEIMEVKPDIFWIGACGPNGVGTFVFKTIERKEKLELASLGYSPNSLSEEFLLDYYKDSKNRIWFITEIAGRASYDMPLSLWYLEGDKIKLVKHGISEVGYYKPNRCFYEDMNGNIFVRIFGRGVLSVNKRGEIKEINRLNGLKISTVKSIISDKNGNIIFIPDYWDPQKFKISSIQILNRKWINKTDKIDKIRAWRSIYTQGDIKKDSKGNLWWLYEDTNKIKSLIKYNGKKIKTIVNISDMIKKMEKKFNYYEFRILYFTIDSKDRLWFYIMGPDIIYTVIYNGINFGEVCDIKKTYKNIALNEGKNYRLGTDDFREETYNPIVTKDKEIFYTGWSNTVYYFNGEKWIDYDMSSIAGEKFSILNPLFVNSEGYVVATAFTNYDIDTDKVSYIFKDRKWEKSQNYFYNPYYKDNLNSTIEYKDKRDNTFLFLRENGLEYRDTNNNLYKIDDIMCPIPFDEGAQIVKIFDDLKGDIWFKYYGRSSGSWKRWAVLNVSKLKELIKEPISIISSVKVGQKVMPLQLSKEVEINKIDYKIKSDSITIKFSVENENNVKVKFSWRLDDSEWSESIDSSSVTLRNLLKGKHIFEVKAIDNKGISSKKPAKLEFEIDYDYTQKLDKIFDKLKSDDKIVKEAMEEFINLKIISKEYLIKKLKETSDETLKWRINAILSRIE